MKTILKVQILSFLISTFPFSDLKPRMKRNYRGHAASLWLNLVPGLETSGSWDSRVQGPHGMLEGATWGLVRNRTTFPGVQQISLNDKVASLASKYGSCHKYVTWPLCFDNWGLCKYIVPVFLVVSATARVTKLMSPDVRCPALGVWTAWPPPPRTTSWTRRRSTSAT